VVFFLHRVRMRYEDMEVKSMTVPCPFCGVSNNVPHETQEACIAALHNEIALIRAIAGHVRSLEDEPERPERAPGHPADPD
jgi:hypothetical protein